MQIVYAMFVTHTMHQLTERLNVLTRLFTSAFSLRNLSNVAHYTIKLQDLVTEHTTLGSSLPVELC